MSRHRVTTSFAPGFFLAKLVQTVPEETAQTWDLRDMRFLASGGDAVSVETCVAASELLSRYGAHLNVITPGFGMTETCAGTIFNTDCPARDIAEGHTFACLGTCNDGVEMRVVVPSNPEEQDGLGKPVADVLALPGKPGNLQLRGPVVFNGYYRDPEASAMAFTEDGWFQTGDEAILDAHGRLHLVGRTKDVMNVNGTKISAHEVQTTLDRALRGRVVWALVFPSRGPGMDTEQVTVAYVPLSTASTDINSTDLSAIADTHGRIIEVIVRSTGSSPIIFNVADKSCLPHSSLGKISRARMRSLFEAGIFDEEVKSHRRKMKSFHSMDDWSSQRPLEEDEGYIMADVLAVLPGLDDEGLGINTPIFDVGCTSMDLIRLKRRIDDRLNIQVPVILLAKNPTVGMLATALRSFVHHQLSSPDTSPGANQLETRTSTSTSIEDYDPVVVLRPSGHKTPLWLIHPGVGEVLVFVGLVHHLRTENRPVYALRAPGFDSGQRRFRSIAEAVTCYQANIRRQQPHGPYAIAGYSYGGMLAFETAKALEAEGQQVRLVAILNLPPHIKARVSSVSWALCLLHVSYFLGLCSEQHVDRVEADPDLCERLRRMPRAEAIDVVLDGCGSEADRIARMAELAQHPASLAVFADVAHGLQSMASEYEPRGNVAALDVFHAMPLRAVAPDRDEWLCQLAPWRDFCRSEVRFHAVGGAHNTMLHPEHVHGFSEMLKMVLKERNI
ncbi:putative secondary metabolism biosynthetic enzyme [Pestalotiopsis sp. 9143b]|nr:putative secondary metabolism biosynthetic enzyme [Pestalotiopsis sp. 9143b]